MRSLRWAWRLMYRYLTILADGHYSTEARIETDIQKICYILIAIIATCSFRWHVFIVVEVSWL
jgi:hypothetical protein